MSLGIASMMNEATKQKFSRGCARSRGQVDGGARMVEQDRYCVDVLLQGASAQGAPGEAGKLVLCSHVETCVSSAMASGKPAARKQKLDELMQVFSRYGCMGNR
jgi:DNA-binding FrmR family transcriptional regulator